MKTGALSRSTSEVLGSRIWKCGSRIIRMAATRMNCRNIDECGNEPSCFGPMMPDEVVFAVAPAAQVAGGPHFSATSIANAYATGAPVYCLTKDNKAAESLDSLADALGATLIELSDLGKLIRVATDEGHFCVVVDAACFNAPTTAQVLCDLAQARPVICLATRADFQIAVRAVQSGAFGIVPLPLVELECRAILKSALKADQADDSPYVRRRRLERRLQTLSARERE